ncbi:GNAT family N-acetyltransferase [Mucilaginibacter arboris]|uniref:GNAT family N-acetyltransferase n=1 Tax=Mucilaginibacter arboris TaxID=2682090 RepID=A0A7K1SWU9_9SPHI|nr:GNAT family N-acetyltransferase [Mucilaginibacter arboris]MVN21774.1 GNAT family N-acetyltransferase [Mucilaginibacter arboris]
MSAIIKSITAEQTWPIRQKVMYPEFEIDKVKLADDAQGRHFGLFVADELTVVVSLFVKDEALQFRKLATLTAQQGKGYGRQMMEFILDLASAENLETIWCNARLTASKFYKTFGLEVSGESWQQNGHEFVMMKKQL